MAEEKLILVLANSARNKRYCVAGKVAIRRNDGTFDATSEWIRLADPSDPKDDAVPYGRTICVGRGSVRPLEIVKVALLGPCNNPDHPEDRFFDPSQPWQFVHSAGSDILPLIADEPETIWHDGLQASAVRFGYVQQMGGGAASLYLVKAPNDWTFTFWKEWNPFEGRDGTKRKLAFNYAGQHHEFSVTDTAFTARHKIYERATGSPQVLESSSPNTYFCLSLTKEFSGKHYKICATVFEL